MQQWVELNFPTGTYVHSDNQYNRKKLWRVRIIISILIKYSYDSLWM